MKNLIVAVDFSPTTQPVLDQAAALSKALGAKLWILHVISAEGQTMAYEAASFADYTYEAVHMPVDVQLARDLNAQELKREHHALLGISAKVREDGGDAQAILLQGPAAKILVEKARELEAEIIILGSHGHSLLRKTLLGSVSESVMRHAPCNVMIVPAAAK